MARLQVVWAVMAGMSVAGACSVADAQVTCVGDGLTSYAYYVNGAGPLMSFFVGTSDLDISNYTNILSPEGWKFGILPEGMSHAHGHFTDHGQVSIGPCWCLTAGRFGWWTDDGQLAMRSFTFGFHSNRYPEDVGWLLPNVPLWADWEEPVGMGAGPVHGPSSRPRPAADFDVDQDVDRVDFLVWQAGYGTTGSASHGDGDTDADGDVDGGDFLIWQQEFGYGSFATAVIPEPYTITLFSLLTLASLALAHRRMRQSGGY